MPKFRYLSDDELSFFEEELKQFLILNHIYAEEWVKINQTEPKKALELVGVFSDQVLQRVYENMKYFEKRTKDACFMFHYDKEQIFLKVIQVESNENLDLSTVESLHEALKNHPENLSFFKSNKKYTTNRELEIHQLIEQGAVPSSKEFWNILEQIIP